MPSIEFGTGRVNGTLRGGKVSNGVRKVVKAEQDEKTQAVGRTVSAEANIPTGSVASAHTIYQIKDGDGNENWTDKYPDDVEDAAENDETARFAVIVRSKKSSDSRRKLEAHSIVVQSPWLKNALGEILRDYPGVSCELTRLVFEAPFKPFLHRWSELLAYLKRDDLEENAREHLNLLYDILADELRDSIKAFEDYISKGVTTWSHAWMIYQPAKVVLSDSKGPMSAYEIKDCDYISTQCGNFLRLSVTTVEWNGRKFGRHASSIDVAEYKGVQKITELAAVPLQLHPDGPKISEALIARGQKFEALAGHHFKFYDGMAITWDNRGNEIAIHHQGRIVIDCKSFDRFSPFSSRHVTPFDDKDMQHVTPLDKKVETNPLAIAAGLQRADGETPSVKLDEYFLMLCHCRVRGYSLPTKKWLDFFVDWIDEITWNTRAFDSLVLPEDQKELILSFTESQVQNRNGFDDVVAGKGQGIIILLAGKPGIGKTLTAESVAESMKRPLHTISSGDLGTNSWDVEHRLTNILELVGRWNAVLLLDECDVFLEARSTHDLNRNALVSTFLRTLEYYQGILFMTTNRADNIDPAFESRIHVSMQYPDLTVESRRKIWLNFLNASSGSHALRDDEVSELAQLELNGRQIKNILKTSHLLASRRREPLKRQFIDTVLLIENKRPSRL